MSENVTRISKGLSLDTSILDQPKSTYRFALNAVVETKDGDMRMISNEESNTYHSQLAVSIYYEVLGSVYIGNNEHLLILVAEGICKFAILSENGISVIFTDSRNYLKFSTKSQIQLEFRVRRGCERWVYFVDENNTIRSFNIDDVAAYVENPTKFELVKGYSKRPQFKSFKILAGGNLNSGSYNFAIQYIDENSNPTEWITTSMCIPIYKSELSGNYDTVLGSSKAPIGEQEPLYGTGKINKSIALTLDNLDENYKQYRIAVIEASTGDGNPTRTLLSQSILISQTEFVYDGNEQNFTIMDINEVLMEMVDLGIPSHICQAEDRLLVARITKNNKNICELQKNASQIRTRFVTKEIPAYDYTQIGDPKNPNTMWEKMSAMGGEVYALGIVYVFNDDTVSPAFHIPGRNAEESDREMINNLDSQAVESGYIEKWRVYETADLISGKMAFWEARNAVYPTRLDCDENSFWGTDADGISLEGKKIRHHKFPGRNLIPHVNPSNTTGLAKNKAIVKFNVYTDVEEFSTQYTYDVRFTVTLNDGSSENIIKTGTLKNEDFDIPKPGERRTYKQIWVLDYSNLNKTVQAITNLRLETCDVCTNSESVTVTTPSGTTVQSTCNTGTVFEVTLSYKIEATVAPVRHEMINLIGVEFSNIILPAGVKGYYFVRGERDDFNRTVLDKAYSGCDLRENAEFIAFTGLTETAINDETITSLGHNDFTKSIISPNNLFRNKELTPSFIKVETFFTKANGSEQGSTGTINGVDDNKSGLFDNDGFDFRGVCRVDHMFCNDKDYNPFDEHNYSVEESIILPPINKKEGWPINNTIGAKQKILYNTCYDNRLQFVRIDRRYDDAVTKGLSSTAENIDLLTINHQKIRYVSLRVERDIHSNLENIKYYKMHNNMLESTDPTEVYGFDTYISHFPITTTINQRPHSKVRILDFVVYAILIIASAVVTIFTAGVGVVVLVAVIAAAVAGLTVTAFQTFAKDFQETSLGDLMVDLLLDEWIDHEYDDTYHAAMEHSTGLFIESEVNIGLREVPNYACIGFSKSSELETIKNYLVDKFTYYDVGTEKHRLKAIPCPEMYLSNMDFQRMNKEKVFFAIPSTYDCCSNCREDFPNRIYYSQRSFQEELVDSFGRFLPLDYIDIPSEYGEITDIFMEKSSLYVKTERALWLLPQNVQERVQGDVVSLIGSGGFFAITPKKLFDIKTGAGGGRQKFATLKTLFGTVFVDEKLGNIYLLNFSSQSGSQLEELSSPKYGMDKWMKKNLKLELVNQIKKKTGHTFTLDHTPASKYCIGIHTAYDNEYSRLLLTKIDYKISSELEEDFDLFYKDNFDENNIIGAWNPSIKTNIIMLNQYDEKFYWIRKDGTNVIGEHAPFTDTDAFENKSFTISFSFNTMSWVSWHSYIPRKYVFDNENLYTSLVTSVFTFFVVNIYRHNTDGDYQRFYGTLKPFIVEYPVIVSPVIDTEIDNIMLQTIAMKNDVEQRFVTFNKIIAFNNRQSSGQLNLVVIDETMTDDYLGKQVVNTEGNIIIKRKKKNWIINDLRDYRIDYSLPLFLNTWEDIKNDYYIDKVINSDSIDFEKDWYDLETFNDKFLNIRLIFDNKNDVKLILNYSVESAKPSKE